MNRRRYRFGRPPSILRRAKLDNLAIVPASLLPFRAKWQKMANELAQDEILIVLPASECSSRKTLNKTISLLKAKGQRVTILPAEQFA